MRVFLILFVDKSRTDIAPSGVLCMYTLFPAVDEKLGEKSRVSISAVLLSRAKTSGKNANIKIAVKKARIREAKIILSILL